MNPFKVLGLYGQIAAALALAGLLVALGLAVRDYGRARTERAAYRECQAVAAGKVGARAPAEACAAPLASAIAAMRTASTCGAGLKPDSAGDWMVPGECGQSVQQLAAERNAGAANLANANRVITALRADRGAAIDRAEARAAADLRRQNDVTTALNRATRDADGRLVCAGDCLRGLAGN